MKIKNLLITFSALVAVFLIPATALADQYGEVEVSKDISLDKKVKKPGTDEWVDNLFASDYKYAPEQEIEFKITVANAGDRDLENIKLKDILPSYLNHVSGDLEYTFNLSVDESRDFYIKARVVRIDELANDQGLYCLVNTAEAWFNDQVDKDTTQICIEKKVLGFVAIPEAGPAENRLILFGSTMLALAGWALIKKSY